MDTKLTRRSQALLAGLGASSAADIATAIGRQVAADQINGIFFRSQISPDVDLDPRAVTSGQARTVSEGGLSELFLRIAKPAVYIDTRFGAVNIAPWGEPTTNYFPLLLIGTVVGTAAIAGLIVRGLKS